MSARGALLGIMLCACGSGVADVGDLPDEGSPGVAGGPSGPDLGIDGGGPGASCTLEGLSQYRLLFDSDSGGLERRIYSMRADGTGLEVLTPPGEIAREPALSPDGDTLAYATPEGIKLLQLGSGESELLIPGADQPNWSGDGTKLAFRINDGISSSYGDVGVRQLSDGTDSLFGCRYCNAPELTSDGVTLVYAEGTFNASDNVVPHVGALEWATGAAREVIVGAGPDIIHPTVSSDSIWVAAALDCPGSAQPALWISPFAVTTPACEGRLTSPIDGPRVRNPQWGPGVFIAYELGESPRDITIVAADTGETCRIQGPGDDRNPAWGSLSIDTPD